MNELLGYVCVGLGMHSNGEYDLKMQSFHLENDQEKKRKKRVSKKCSIKQINKFKLTCYTVQLFGHNF